MWLKYYQLPNNAPNTMAISCSYHNVIPSLIPTGTARERKEKEEDIDKWSISQHRVIEGMVTESENTVLPPNDETVEYRR